jgi:inner membrane protein
MDPLAHTLAGASLAQSGLKRLTPLATATLVIGANLPDVDGVASLWGGDASLYFRRGWTHGALSMLVWPFLLTGLMLGLDALRRRGHPEATPARAGPLLALAVIGVWSHPALDWLNTYGVRLLMPFSDQWFYGDAVFIVDPWLWLLLAAAVVVASTAGAPGIVGWGLVGVATTAVLMLAEEVPAAARVLWCVGIGAILLARLSEGGRTRVTQIARGCLIASAVYIALMIVGSRIATAYAVQWLDREGGGYRELMAGPLPVNPAVREVIVARHDRYSFLKVNVVTGSLQPFGPDVPINGATAITEAALNAPQVRGLRGWTRFPSYEVERLGDGYRVHIRDVRYSRFGPRARGIGVGVVELDSALRPR